MKRGGWADRPGAVVVVVAIAYLLFLGSYLLREDLDISSFIAAGDRFADVTETPPGIAVRPDSVGYDGQFYYRLALEPFPEQATGFGIRLDSPAYRQQRILYPLLVHVLMAGRIELVPWLMVLINFVGLCLLGWGGGVLAQRGGWHAQWGALLALYPGFLFTASRDLTEILAGVLLMGSVLAWQRRRIALATVLLALAVLAKETTLLLAGAAVLAAMWTWWTGRTQAPTPTLSWRAYALYGLLPLFVYMSWQLYLAWHWEMGALAEGGGNVGSPFWGVARFIARMMETGRIGNAGRLRAAITLLQLGALTYFALAVARVWRGNLAGRPVRWGWLLYGLLTLSLTDLVWVEDQAFLRALTEFYLLGCVLVLCVPARGHSRRALLVMAGLWLVGALDLLLLR